MKPKPTDQTWMEFASKAKPKPKPKSVSGPCMTALREAQAVMARHRSGELTRDEADRMVDEIVSSV